MPLSAPPALATYLVVAVLLVAALVLLTGRLAPRVPNAAKARPYESGVSEPIATVARWPVRYALVGMLFLVFDVEALFFYPWAVILRQLRWYGVIEMFIFMLILLVALAHIWRKGGLDWE